MDRKTVKARIPVWVDENGDHSSSYYPCGGKMVDGYEEDPGMLETMHPNIHRVWLEGDLPLPGDTVKGEVSDGTESDCNSLPLCPLPLLNKHRYVLNKNLSDGTMAIFRDGVQLTADEIYGEIMTLQERLNAAVNQLHERMRDETISGS